MDLINPKNGPIPHGHYSHAVRTGNLLFISGQVPFHPVTDELIGVDIATQTAQTMQNLKELLEAVGLSMKNVVKTTVFLSNWDNFPEFNKVYVKYMGDHKPARATVEISRIASGALLEIDAVAEME